MLECCGILVCCPPGTERAYSRELSVDAGATPDCYAGEAAAMHWTGTGVAM